MVQGFLFFHVLQKHWLKKSDPGNIWNMDECTDTKEYKKEWEVGGIFAMIVIRQRN